MFCVTIVYRSHMIHFWQVSCGWKHTAAISGNAIIFMNRNCYFKSRLFYLSLEYQIFLFQYNRNTLKIKTGNISISMAQLLYFQFSSHSLQIALPINWNLLRSSFYINYQLIFQFMVSYKYSFQFYFIFLAISERL